jgi:nicotinamidase-related amidase
MRSLVVIDLLNDFLDQVGTNKVRRLVRCTNDLVAAFRRSGLPVVWVRQEFRPDLSDAFLEMRDRQIAIAIEGTRGAELHTGLDYSPADITVIKKRYSAFFNTELEEVLARLDVGEVVLCGINTHACVRMTAIDAYQRDLRVVLAEECIDSYDEEHARISLRYMNGKIVKLASVAEIVSSLGSG